MNKYLLIILIAYITISCSEKKVEDSGHNTYLSLYLEEGAGKEIRLIKVEANDSEPVDSFIIPEKDSVFISFYTENQSFFKIRNSENNSITFLAGINDTAIIRGHYYNFGDYTLSGSKDNEQISILNRKTKEFLGKIDRIAAITRDSARSPNYGKIKSELDKEYHELYKEFREFTLEFIHKNRESLVSLLALTNQLGYNFYTFHPEKDMDIFLETDSVLFDLYPDYGPVISLHRKMIEIKNQNLQIENNQKRVDIGDVAPEISLPDTSRQIKNLSDLRGNIVLVNFWASWSPPCRKENQNLVELYNKYNIKGLEIFQVSLDNSMEEWLNVIRKDSLDWIHVSDLNHWESEAIIPYGLDNIPANFLVDTKGKIIAKDLYGKKLSQKLQEIFN